jgi:predicted HTH transcriptional regulator
MYIEIFNISISEKIDLICRLIIMASTLELNLPKYLGKGIFDPPANVEDIIFKVLGAKGDMTRSEMKELTKIPRTTIYDTIERLIYEEKIEKYPVFNKARGRPKIFYRLIKK